MRFFLRKHLLIVVVLSPAVACAQLAQAPGNESTSQTSASLAAPVSPAQSQQVHGVPGSTKKGGSFASHSEAALLFTYIHSSATYSNEPAGGFALAGATAAGAYRFRPHISAVAEFSGTHVNGVQNTGLPLTLLTYLFGARYGFSAGHHLVPFGQLLVGEAHATGGIYPANTVTSGGADGFASTLGGGVDYPLSPSVSLRAQADYLFTDLPNGANNHQSDLRLSAGLAFHFGVR